MWTAFITRKEYDALIDNCPELMARQVTQTNDRKWRLAGVYVEFYNADDFHDLCHALASINAVRSQMT